MYFKAQYHVFVQNHRWTQIKMKSPRGKEAVPEVPSKSLRGALRLVSVRPEHVEG